MSRTVSRCSGLAILLNDQVFDTTHLSTCCFITLVDVKIGSKITEIKFPVGYNIVAVY